MSSQVSVNQHLSSLKYGFTQLLRLMKKVMFTVRNIFMLTALSNQLTSGLH